MGFREELLYSQVKKKKVFFRLGFPEIEMLLQVHRQGKGKSYCVSATRIWKLTALSEDLNTTSYDE